MKRKKTKRMLGIITILCMLIPLLAGAAYAAETAVKPGQLKKITFVYGMLAPTPWPVWTAQEKGIFKKYGLDVTLIRVNGGPEAIQALMGGSAQVALAGAPEIMNAASAGADLMIIATLSNVNFDSLLSLPKIDSPTKLKGGKVAISKWGSLSHMTAWLMVNDIGLDPDKDVMYIEIGNDTARAAALQAGSVEAAVVNGTSGNKLEKELGFRSLVRGTEKGITFPNTNIFTSTQMFKNDPTTLKNLIKSVLDGMDWVYNPANADNAKQILAKQLNVKPDDASVSVGFDQYIKLKGLNANLRIDPARFEKVAGFSVKFNDKMAKMDVRKYLDNAIIDAAVKERK